MYMQTRYEQIAASQVIADIDIPPFCIYTRFHFRPSPELNISVKSFCCLKNMQVLNTMHTHIYYQWKKSLLQWYIEFMLWGHLFFHDLLAQ